MMTRKKVFTALSHFGLGSKFLAANWYENFLPHTLKYMKHEKGKMTNARTLSRLAGKFDFLNAISHSILLGHAMLICRCWLLIKLSVFFFPCLIIEVWPQSSSVHTCVNIANGWILQSCCMQDYIKSDTTAISHATCKKNDSPLATWIFIDDMRIYF